MSDEITEFGDRLIEASETAPAVIEEPAIPTWNDLSLSDKVDLLHAKVDAVGAQTTWIGATLQGIIDMVGKVSPMDIFKMMKGGK